jgi:predicted porin
MKKTLVALAALAATSAFAQSSVTLYGQFDAGVYSLTNMEGKDKSATVYGDGATYSNILGFKGTEDIGGGLTAGFDFQTDVQTNNGGLNAAGLFRRQANGNIESKKMGQLKFGITTNPIIATNGALMPVGGNSVTTATSGALGYSDFYTKNAVTYTSPSIMGLVAQFQSGMSNNTESSGDGSVTAYSLAYVNNALEVRYAAQDRNSATAAIAGTAPNGSGNSATATAGVATFDKKSSVFGVKYTMGAFSVGVATMKSEGQLGYTLGTNTKNTAASVMSRTANQFGLGYTNGAWTLGTTLTQAEDSQLTNVQARYALSKRTNVIATYGLADNKGDKVAFLPFAFNTGTAPATIVQAGAMAPTKDAKQSGFGVALTHSF